MMGYWNQGILREWRHVRGEGPAGPGRGPGGRALPEVQPLGQDGVLLHAADAVEEDGALAALHCGESGGLVSAGGGSEGSEELWGGLHSPMKTDSRTP